MMKNNKRIFAILLAISMMLSTYTVTFAGGGTDAQILYELGRLEDIRPEALDETLTRVIGITMVMKALGYTGVDADGAAANSNFTDLEGNNAWAKGWIQLAYEEGIVLGEIDGKIFNPDGILTAQEFVAFLLRALDYDTVLAYTNADDLGTASGIVTDFEDINYTKGEAASAMLDGLKAKLQDDSGLTLIEKLVLKGIVTKSAALEVGMVIEIDSLDTIEVTGEAEDYYGSTTTAEEDELISDSNSLLLINAEANQSDRIILYFNQPVNIDDFRDEQGALDMTYFSLYVEKDSREAGEGTAVELLNVLPLEGDDSALQVLLDVEGNAENALTDNENVYVAVVNKTGVVNGTREETFIFTDVRKPVVLTVDNEGLSVLKVIFSEPIETVTAETARNWSIDGLSLDYKTWGVDNLETQAINEGARIEVGTYTLENGDLRQVVTLTLGYDQEGNRIYFTPGEHSLQVANIGDWAYLSDSKNLMDTQIIDFEVEADTTTPTATVEIQSPKQWVVSFGTSIVEDKVSSDEIRLQIWDEDYNEWLDVTNQSYEINKAGDSDFIIEVEKDWIEVYDTVSTGKYYYNDSYRLKLVKGAFTKTENGIKNETILLELKDKMLFPDITSPSIVEIEEMAVGSQYLVSMSEPIQLESKKVNETNDEATQITKALGSAYFIKSDYSETVEGKVSSDIYEDPYDMTFTVTPNSEALSAGDWILVVKSISDDMGNTAASTTFAFSIEEVAEVTDFEVILAFADVDMDFVFEAYDAYDDDLQYDYICVKFSKAITVTGREENVLMPSNYQLNGETLPQRTQIVGNIAGYDMDDTLDSITIILPEGTIAKNSPNILSISHLLESSEGDTLMNAGDYVLFYEITED
jgi:hypothetical protein